VCVFIIHTNYRQCDNYNLHVKSHRRCNNTCRMNVSGGYVGHVTIFSCMFTIACCLVVGLGLGLGLGLDFVSCNAHVFVRL